MKAKALIRWSAYVTHLVAGGTFDDEGLTVFEGLGTDQYEQPNEWHDIHEHAKAGSPWDLV